MKKKLLALGLAVGLIALMLPLFAAFEAHIINVRCYVEHALAVSPTGEINLGTVFPNEVLDPVGLPIVISMSRSFQDTERVRDVKYRIVQKSKNHYQGTGYGEPYWDAHNLSGWLTKHKDKVEGEENDNSATHEGKLDKDYTGTPSGPDIVDVWALDLHVPPITGHMSQADIAAGDVSIPGEGWYGCDLWIETYEFSYRPQ